MKKIIYIKKYTMYVLYIHGCNDRTWKVNNDKLIYYIVWMYIYSHMHTNIHIYANTVQIYKYSTDM